ncbi:phosphatase family protein [Metarhizium album ARSEF 1941]|uniref:Phosphatase family protein n=1 Tax=Metarhizium album (strain ARSEF 1941) TaxID=1081103 RepID=A0A0B2WV20_METAS|nr:phosphatase family protein [Metarhizium album ARSEF 1941]KHN97282.1 phosphatase family protein [Metarhizium album ARSEF 1941]
MAAPDSPPSTHSDSFEPVEVFTTPQSLARAVRARRHEYLRPHKLRVKIGTWNVAACTGTDKDLARWFVDGQGLDQNFATLDLSRNPAVAHHDPAADQHGDPDAVQLLGGSDIGLYVLGLQEVVDLNATKEYMNRAVNVDSSPVGKWQAALEAAMPPGYQPIMSGQMAGLLLLIYASPEIAPTITNVSTRQVGTGLLGYFGNKGAITSRLVLGEATRMVFINCHLASGAGSGYLDRRCWDVDQILTKTKFDPVVHAGVSDDDGDTIGDEDFAFWFGDLNFRLDGLPGDDIRRILMLHTRGEYALRGGHTPPPPEGEGVIVMRDSESDDDTTTRSSVHSRDQSFDSETTLPDPDDFPQDPSQDPTSLQATLDSLLPHDQLRRMMAQRRVFHDGWREGPITFLPSYKYDVGTVGLFDSSEKRRAPSWCDRILYRTRKDKQAFDAKLAEEMAAKKKDEEMKSRGIDQDDDVLFSYDPDTDGDEQAGVEAYDYDEYDETQDDVPREVTTNEASVDRIALDIYTSHQRITSSDHKPIISVFSLEYDAVVPELKAKVHAEVAWELDRAENEGRPTVTIAMEGDKSGNEDTVDFGDVGFLERKSIVFTVANTGSVPASLLFTENPTKGDADSPSLNWLTPSFLHPDPDDDPPSDLGQGVTLQPGETALAHIQAQVSNIAYLRALNDGRTSLEDVLVLRVEDGRDHFIPVKGAWLPTCFGRSIDELIRVPDGGIRKYCIEKNIRGAIPYDSDVRCSAPKEIFKLTEAIQTLVERCVAEEAMLESKTLPREPGWPFDSTTWTCGLAERDETKAGLVAALDKDSPIAEALPGELPSSHKLELLSSTLLLFLVSLTDGLVPPLLWAKLSTSLPNLASLAPTAWTDAKVQILDIFSSAPHHNIAFVFLTSTLARVATELSPATSDALPPGLSRRLNFRRGEDDGDKKRKLRQRKYAEVIGPIAFRANEGDKMAKERERVVEIFLTREAGG